MTNTDFISTKFIRDNYPINANIDDSVLKPIIPITQDIFILPILGTSLYSKMQTLVQTSGNTLDGVSGPYYNLMYTYIQPALLHYVVYESLDFFNLRITNINVGKHNTDTSQPVNLDELNQFKRHIFNNANYFAERTSRYLIANQQSFPEYYSAGTLSDTVIPRPTQYFSGIHIPSYFGEDIFGNFANYCMAMRGHIN